MRHLVVLGALVSTALMAGCDGPELQDKAAKDDNPASAFAKRDLPDIEVIQNLVSRSCNCRMAGRDPTVIAKRIAEVTKGLETDGYGTSSYPLTFESTCYPELGPKGCVSDGAKTVAHGELVCSAEQISELEELWNRNMSSKGGPTKKADAAVTRRISEMQAEVRRHLSQIDCE